MFNVGRAVCIAKNNNLFDIVGGSFGGKEYRSVLTAVPAAVAAHKYDFYFI